MASARAQRNAPVPPAALPANVQAEAEAGFKYVAEVVGWDLWTNEHHIPRAVGAAVSRALATGHYVPLATHTALLIDSRSETTRWRESWASEMVRADQQLQRVQRSLLILKDTDPDTAARLATEIGVCL